MCSAATSRSRASHFLITRSEIRVPARGALCWISRMRSWSELNEALKTMGDHAVRYALCAISPSGRSSYRPARPAGSGSGSINAASPDAVGQTRMPRSPQPVRTAASRPEPCPQPVVLRRRERERGGSEIRPRMCRPEDALFGVSLRSREHVINLVGTDACERATQCSGLVPGGHRLQDRRDEGANLIAVHRAEGKYVAVDDLGFRQRPAGGVGFAVAGGTSSNRTGRENEKPRSRENPPCRRGERQSRARRHAPPTAPECGPIQTAFL